MKFLRGEIAAPVFWYLALTVGVPLAGGGGMDTGFRRHALTILLVVAVLTAARIGLSRSASPARERNAG